MMAALRAWLFGRIRERNARDAEEREVIQREREASAAVNTYAQQAADRGAEVAERGMRVAAPTGMLVRDLIGGTYDPDSPLYGGRGR